MKRFHRAFLLAAALVAAQSAPQAQAAGVLVQSFADMAAFQASPFYDFVVNQLPGGLGSNCPSLVTDVAQGDAAVPWSSAGAPLNVTVTPEVESALDGSPTVFAGSVDTTVYQKQFVSIGNETAGGGTPKTQIAIPPVVLPAVGGFQGYDLAVIDLGTDLVPASGSKNSERTTFRVENSGGGGAFLVAQITNTGGNYINVILLDLDGIPGSPSLVDRLDIVDASGHNPPQKGSLDIDGVLRLTDNIVPVLSATWGRMKSVYR
jgi:hypothetical protein